MSLKGFSPEESTAEFDGSKRMMHSCIHITYAILHILSFAQCSFIFVQVLVPLCFSSETAFCERLRDFANRCEDAEKAEKLL